jgi:hypothetical protein
MSTHERQVRELIARYASGQIDIKTFWNVLSELAWEAEAPEESDAAKLVYEAMTLMAEHQNGHRTEESLREELRELVVSVNG